MSIAIDQIETPALLVDLDAMESNLHQMASFFAQRECKLRPHFKNHKSPVLALQQIRAGAIGMTCATVREAEILVEHGIPNILIANEIAGAEKPDKVAALSRHASVVVAIDNQASVRDLAAAQRNRNSQIEVVVDINVGLDRCGVAAGAPALELARYAAQQGLAVRGIMGYDGQLQVIAPSAERDEKIRQGSKTLVDSAALLEANGLQVSIVSTGGTGSFFVSGDYPGITDIQAGSYLLMDDHYVVRRATFKPSLTVLATVISTRVLGHAVLNCGVKVISGERGLPTLKNLPGARLTALHAEHALVEIDPSQTQLIVGQKIEIRVLYSDATVNLNSRIHGVRNGQLEEIIRIEH